MDGRRRQAGLLALLVVGVVLSLLCANAQASLVRRREAECDASLPLPATAYVLGGIGLLVGLVALMLLVRSYGQSRQVITFVLVATSIAAVVFELFVLITAIQAQSPSSVCGFPPPPGG